MPELATKQKTTVINSNIVNSKNELLKLKDFQDILEIYGTFPSAFNEILLGENFYIDKNFWPTLSTEDCKELFEIIPSENFHVKKILFRILINRKEITEFNIQDYLQKLDSIKSSKRFFELFKDYMIYVHPTDSL